MNKTLPQVTDIIKRIDGNMREYGYVLNVTNEGILVEFLGQSRKKGTPGIWQGDYEIVSNLEETEKSTKKQNS